MISAGRCAGFLEGMDCVAQNTGLQQRLQCSPVHHVTRTVEEFVDVKLQSCILEDAHRPLLIEIYQHIDVAFIACFSARYRTEHGRVCHSKSPQISLMGTERGKNALKVRTHSSHRV